MGIGEGDPFFIGGHWLGDAGSKSYHVLRSSGASLPAEPPFSPSLPPSTTPSAGPASSGCWWVSAFLNLSLSFGISDSTISV